MSDLDLSKLSDAQLGALKLVGGDLSKLPDAMLLSLKEATAPAPSDTGRTAARIVGQGAQGFNDAIASTVGAPVDATAFLLRKAGVKADDPFGGSESIKRGIDYVATLPGRAKDAIGQGSLAPLTEDRTSRFGAETQAERIANATGEGLGTAASMVAPFGMLAKATEKAAPLTSSIFDSLAQGPKTQAAANVAGNVAGTETDNPYVGAGVSMLTPLLTHGAQRMVSAAPAANDAEVARRGLIETARKNNIPLSAGDITDSKKLKTLESWVDTTPLPLLGGGQTVLNAAKQEGFNKALLGTAGENATAATDDVMQRMFNRIGGKFDSLAKSTSIRVDPQFGADLDRVEQEYGRQLMSTMKKGTLDKIDELRSAAKAIGSMSVDTSGNAVPNLAVSIDGDIYKNVRSALSKETLNADPHVRDAAKGMIDALDGVLGRSLGPNGAKEWQEARRLYRNAITIKEAVQARNNPNTAVGNIPPAAIASRSETNPDLHRLAEVGNAFVGDKIPNSGTGPRNVLNALALGGGGGMATGLISPTQALVGAGVAATPYALNAAMNNPATRALLMYRLRNPSEGAASKGLVASLLAQQGVKTPSMLTGP